MRLLLLGRLPPFARLHPAQPHHADAPHGHHLTHDPRPPRGELEALLSAEARLGSLFVCVCGCVCACVHAGVCACVCACVLCVCASRVCLGACANVHCTCARPRTRVLCASCAVASGGCAATAAAGKTTASTTTTTSNDDHDSNDHDDDDESDDVDDDDDDAPAQLPRPAVRSSARPPSQPTPQQPLTALLPTRRCQRGRAARTAAAAAAAAAARRRSRGRTAGNAKLVPGRSGTCEAPRRGGAAPRTQPLRPRRSAAPGRGPPMEWVGLGWVGGW